VAAAPPPKEAHAPWLRRVVAQLIDLVIIGVPFGIVGAVVGGDAGIGIAALGAVAYALYAGALMARPGNRNGQTLGKQLLGIRVVWDGREAVTFLHGLYREGCVKLFWWLLSAGIWAVIDCLFPLWDAEAQAWHDGVVSTHVLRVSPAPASAAELAVPAR
jgi:uncharacterized RDD family membrane protein YckC